MDTGRFIVLVPIGDLPSTGVGGALGARAEELRERIARGEARPEEVRALCAIEEVLSAANGSRGGAGGPTGGAGTSGSGAPAEPALLLKVEDVARLLGVSKPHAYNLVARGEIPSVRIGRSLRVRRDQLLAWLDATGSERNGRRGGAR